MNIIRKFWYISALICFVLYDYPDFKSLRRLTAIYLYLHEYTYIGQARGRAYDKSCEAPVDVNPL